MHFEFLTRSIGRINFNFLLYLIGSFGMISIFYGSITFTPLYVFELGGNEFYAGLQNSLFLVTAVALRFYFGPLGDTVGRKIPLLIGALVFALTPLAFYFSHSIPALISARLFEAIGAGAFLNAAASIAADFAPKDKIGSYMAGVLCLYPLSLTIAPATAGHILSTSGFSGVFIQGFIAGVVFLIFLLLVKYPAEINNQNDKNTSGMAGLVNEAIRYRPTWLMFFGILFVYVCVGAVITYVPVYAGRVIDVGNTGIYFTYMGITGVLSTLLTGYLSDRLGRANVLTPALTIFGLAMMLIYFLPGNPAVFVISGLFVGFGAYASSGVLQQWIVTVTEERIRATMMALTISMIDLSFALGAFIVGAAIGFLSIGQSLTILGSTLLVYTTILIIKESRDNNSLCSKK